MKTQITKAKEMLRRGLVKRDSENCWTVGDELDYHIVVRDVKSGRSQLRCDCKNSSRFCNSDNLLCYHLLSVILFESTIKLQEKINKIIKELEKFEKINMKPENAYIIESLKDLRSLHG